MEYSKKFGSTFPSTLIDVGTRRDVDEGIVHLVNKYHSYIKANDIAGATNFYNENKECLEPYRIDMQYCNRLEEEIFNAGLLALNTTTTILTEQEPASQSEGSYWLQDY